MTCFFNPGILQDSIQYIGNSNGPFAWLVDHLHVVGWPVVVYATYLVTKSFGKLDGRWKTVEDNVTVIVNHLPGLSTSVHELNQTMKGFERDFRTYLVAQNLAKAAPASTDY